MIDSREAIIDGFAHALRTRGLRPLIDLADIRIGPPLTATLSALSGINDPQRLATLIEDFKHFYDNKACLSSAAYSGVNELLDALSIHRIPCFIATNKRQIPTRKILDNMGWQTRFSSVFTLDCRKPAFPDKAAMLSALMQECRLAPTQSLYVGDTPDDELAAHAAGMAFAAAQWGYGNFDDMKESGFANPTALLDYLRS